MGAKAAKTVKARHEAGTSTWHSTATEAACSVHVGTSVADPGAASAEEGAVRSSSASSAREPGHVGAKPC